MKFGEFPLSQALGATLAHSVRLPSGLLKKGHILTQSDIQALIENNISHVMAAIFEPEDMTEDKAATRIAGHICGTHISCAAAFTGRVNLYAAADGLVTIDVTAVDGLNHMDEAITLATVSPHAVVRKGQMVATVKIIPLAVKNETVARVTAQITAGLINLHPFQPQKILMIQTELAGGQEKLFAKSRKVMAHRLAEYGADITDEVRCPHREVDLSDLLTSRIDGDQDMILIMGASAITDRRDVIPAAITAAGGEVIHYGMPVDPGNLMLLAKLKGKWVLGLPGCSRSPKLNGIDLILSRICAGRAVTGPDIMAMGVGGLLSEYPGRPQPRESRKGAITMEKPKKIAALILAAGQSRRMGQDNKLLLPYGEETVLSHVLTQVRQAGLENIYGVTGHQRQAIEQEFSRHNVTAFHNDLYAEGMSTSVKLGIRSLPSDCDAVLIILGDMPNISADILKQIMAAYDPACDRSIIIPTCNGKRGNPILWDRAFFSDFEELAGDMGAKKLLGDYPEFIHEVDVDSDVIFLDIDTYEAYARLKKNR
ncbi:Molybdopterin molybdenumtransferase / Molybdenum cofactor cytidylyltransferase [hydrothermal vent metagenome]|uniref:Molybdopterin molybdenumtransferase / Molybdenum cofactor cytidylyltransferase n=1 Tax=hydrothermal vent metagenome TaxID=652676 RepID=A0A3B0RH47_9ZZZZ